MLFKLSSMIKIFPRKKMNFNLGVLFLGFVTNLEEKKFGKG